MFNASYKIATIFGIPIKLHASVIILLFMYMSDFSFPYGILIAAGILTSICLHELGHSLVAMSKKCRVREITLMFMGGVAQMESIPRKPVDEFLMAIAGPIVSVSLGVALIVTGLRFPLPPIPELGRTGFPFFGVVSWNFFFFLGVVNCFLAVFNMIPAFPMDGGRVLRAGLTPFLGRLKATRIAVGIGKFSAVAFGIWGFMEPFSFWPMALGLFIYFAANQEYRMVLMQERGRPFGFWDWVRKASGQQTAAEKVDQDQVTISPPPYERGPSSRSSLSEDTHNPLDNLRP
jgi:Zn-dependent protease